MEKPLSEKEYDDIWYNADEEERIDKAFYAKDVKQAVKEAYSEIVSMSGIYSVPVKRVFKDKFGFELE